MSSRSNDNTPSNTPGSIPPLNAAFVRSVKRIGAYGDGRGGHGLILRVKPRKGGGVTKNWVQRLRMHGKPFHLGLGTYPGVTLARAREVALSNRRSIADGHDPRVKPEQAPTFAEAAEQVITLRAPTWKDSELESKIWRASFRNYVLPTLGNKRVTEITAADVLRVLTPIWGQKQETARRVRQRIASVMRWCIAQGYRTDNPAGEAISGALPRHRGPKRNFPALPYSEVGGALEAVQKSGAYVGTKLCFAFLVLTATRSGEARLALWDEIDFDSATWTIPAERMKAGRPHRVPLSREAVDMLELAQAIRDRSGLIFPSASGQPMSNMTLSKLIKELGIPAVPHGFRSSFRDWGSEQTDTPRAVLEAALAHRLGDLAEQAYARSDLFEKRRTLMQAWANYLAAGLTGSDQIRRFVPMGSG